MSLELILDTLAHCGAAWTFGDKPGDPAFEDLKRMHREMPSNRYKAEKIVEALNTRHEGQSNAG